MNVRIVINIITILPHNLKMQEESTYETFNMHRYGREIVFTIAERKQIPIK